MSGWYDTLFGNLPPPQPARPTSQGSLFGMQGSSIGAGYQALPTSPNIDDRRQDPADYAYWLNKSPGASSNQYLPSMSGGAPPSGYDPMLTAATLLSPDEASDVAPYTPSYQQNWRPRGLGQAPYRPSPTGPYLPPPPFTHLPIAPGDPGWSPPPSLAGPHNRQGDPARPGYDNPTIDPTSLAHALRAWGGWQ